MKVLITGGAGYIGSILCGSLLNKNYEVVVLDDLLFGIDSLLPYFSFSNFKFYKENVTEKSKIEKYFEGVDTVVHLSALVGFPACQQVGKDVAWLYNYEATKNVFECSEKNNVKRFIFSSTYSNYGISNDGKPVNEQSPLNPQSLYAETKIASENYLIEQGKNSNCCNVIFRFSTLFGISPRTRFDLIINQFVLEALTKRKLIIYQKNYNRSFIHIKDIVRAITMGIEKEHLILRNQIFNVGSNNGNYSKEAIINLIKKYIPNLEIKYKDLSFGGDMRDIQVSFDKIKSVLGFESEISIEEGIKEVCEVLQNNWLYAPESDWHKNAKFIVQ